MRAFDVTRVEFVELCAHLETEENSNESLCLSWWRSRVTIRRYFDKVKSWKLRWDPSECARVELSEGSCLI